MPTKDYAVLIVDEAGDTILDLSVMTSMPELLGWWIHTTVDDFNATIPKISEYGKGEYQQEEGSADLRLIGESIAELTGLHGVDSALKQEIGAWHYLQGKVARCVASYKQGKPAKPDTLLDASVYTMMMRRLQETGQWP